MRHLRFLVLPALAAAALATMLFAAGQQPTGDPFTTEIRKIKDGLYVIPGYDGAVTGGNVAVRSPPKARSSSTTAFRRLQKTSSGKSGP